MVVEGLFSVPLGGKCLGRLSRAAWSTQGPQGANVGWCVCQASVWWLAFQTLRSLAWFQVKVELWVCSRASREGSAKPALPVGPTIKLESPWHQRKLSSHHVARSLLDMFTGQATRPPG